MVCHYVFMVSYVTIEGPNQLTRWKNSYTVKKVKTEVMEVWLQNKGISTPLQMGYNSCLFFNKNNYNKPASAGWSGGTRSLSMILLRVNSF